MPGGGFTRWIFLSVAVGACQPPLGKVNEGPSKRAPPEEPGCAHAPLSPGDGFAQSDGASWYYELVSVDQRSRLRIDLLAKWGGPSGPGTYSLNGVNYRDCGLCVIAYTECEEGACGKILYADQGTVVINELGALPGQQIAGTLKNVVLREVTLGPDWRSSPVEGGSTWCLGELPFHQVLGAPNDINHGDEVVPEVTSPHCEPTGNGNGLSANIGDFALQNCHGEFINLHSLGCADQIGALWLVASTDWCAPCHQYADRAHLLEKKHRDRGLALLKVIGEDALGEAPTLETCRAYATRHHLSFARTFIDPNWETLWKFVYPYAALNGTVSLPWVGILKRSNTDYRFNNQLHPATSEGDVLSELLSEAPSAPAEHTP